MLAAILSEDSSVSFFFATFFRLQSTSVETDREGLAPDSMPTASFTETKRRTLNNYQHHTFIWLSWFGKKSN